MRKNNVFIYEVKWTKWFTKKGVIMWNPDELNEEWNIIDRFFLLEER